MIERRIVRRYALALFRAANKEQVIDRVESDLGLIGFVLQGSAQLKKTLISPLLPAGKKKEIVRDIFEDKVHPITFSYLNLLIEKRREEAIEQTENEYIELANQARLVLTVEVTTVVHLSLDEEARLVEKLTNIYGKKIQLKKHVSSEIIGGAKLKVGDKVIDGSIKTALSSLKEKLLNG